MFISNISHELRTPLNALLGMAQLLDRAELEKPHRDHVKVMLEAGSGLQTLLDDVIALTRADDDRMRDEDCDPAQAARAVARLLQPRAWEKRLRLLVRRQAILPRVAADPRRVRQILLKLVDNALKFTDRGGVEIRVESESGDRRPRDGALQCHRHRTGRAEGNRARPLQAVHPRRHFLYAPQQGAGLGLAVVKRIVEAAGGTTGFESEPGQGATFWFTIPEAGTASAGFRSPIPADTPCRPSGLSVLILAHDDGIDLQLANLLEPFGNHVHIAASLAEAVADVRQRRVRRHPRHGVRCRHTRGGARHQVADCGADPRRRAHS